MKFLESTRINKYIIRRVIIALYTTFIALCTTYVMFNVYVPSNNALRALCSVCMDVICLIILLILICSITFDYHGSNKTTKLFACLLIGSIWAIFLDFLNWAFDGTLAFGQLTFLFTLGSLCMGAIIAALLLLYLYMYMYETHHLTSIKNKVFICVIINIIAFFLTFILAITGTAFEFVDGHYKTGELYDIVTVLPILAVLFFTGYLFYHIKDIGFHDVFAVAGYIVFMIAGALIEAQYNIGTTYVSVAIADIFIYVMLQNQIIAQEKQNAQNWMNKSHTDPLTGLFNRRAYEQDIRTIEENGIASDFVYISIDVNALKATNDSLGHTAGDELLTGASECLKLCFGSYGKIYRIGGDEFIALINIESDNLKRLKNDIELLTKSWSGKLVHSLSISCGYVTRIEAPNMTLAEISELADKKMYDAKNEYYMKSGIDRRKNN